MEEILWQGKSATEDFTDLYLCVNGDLPVSVLRELIAGSWGIDPACFTFYINDEADSITGASHADAVLASIPLNAKGELLVTVRLHAGELLTRAVGRMVMTRKMKDSDQDVAFYNSDPLLCWGCRTTIQDPSRCLELVCGHTHCDACADSKLASPFARCTYCQVESLTKEQQRGSDSLEELRSASLCEVCTEVATQRCQCDIILCDAHSKSHGKQFKGHRTTQLTHADLTAFCTFHEADDSTLHVKERLRFYCTVHDEGICAYCDHDDDAKSTQHTLCPRGSHIALGRAAAHQTRAMRRHLQQAFNDMDVDISSEDDAASADIDWAVYRSALTTFANDAAAFVRGRRRDLAALPVVLRHGAIRALRSVELLQEEEIRIRLWFLHLINSDICRSSARREEEARRAADCGLRGTLQLLHLLDTKLDAPNEDGNTPFHMAAAKGQTETVRLLAVLLGGHVKPNAANKKGAAPLYMAAQNGHTATVLLLRNLGADVTAQQVDGWTPLHVASWNGHTETVRLLVRLGADVNAVNKNGATPLYIASGAGRTATVLLLRNLGADVTAQQVDGCTPLHVASANGHTETVMLLHDLGCRVDTVNKQNATPLYIASGAGRTATVQLLKTLGADVNTVNRIGATPLYVASQDGRSATVELLHSLGADVNAQQVDEWTPLHVASLTGQTETVRLLLILGGRVNAVNKNGATPLYIASQGGHLATVELLHSLGADVNAQQKDGWTPLHVASHNGHSATVELLHSLGADVNAHDVDQWTPLHVASQNGHTETVRLLLNFGANVNATIKNGATPLYIAAENGHTTTVQLLLAHGANTNVQAWTGVVSWSSPKDIASSKGHVDVVNLLKELSSP